MLSFNMFLTKMCAYLYMLVLVNSPFLASFFPCCVHTGRVRALSSAVDAEDVGSKGIGGWDRGEAVHGSVGFGCMLSAGNVLNLSRGDT